MTGRIVGIYHKYEELVYYVIVGGMTTLVSWIVYFGSVFTFLDAENAFQLQVANILSWVAGVAFAYVTNRIFVFKSKEKNMFFEFIKFSSSKKV